VQEAQVDVEAGVAVELDAHVCSSTPAFIAGTSAGRKRRSRAC
jgi:hypothetical protein